MDNNTDTIARAIVICMGVADLTDKRELEDIRNHLLEGIAIIDRLIEKETMSGEAEDKAAQAFQVYYLSGGTRKFKGKKPVWIAFPDGQREFVRTWKEAVQVILDRCLEDGNEGVLREIAGNVAGRKRVFLAKTDEHMRSPVKISDGLYMETHYDTETLLYVLTYRILDAIGYDYSGIQITTRTN